MYEFWSSPTTWLMIVLGLAAVGFGIWLFVKNVRMKREDRD